MIFDGFVSEMTCSVNIKLTKREKYLMFKIVNR